MLDPAYTGPVCAWCCKSLVKQLAEGLTLSELKHMHVQEADIKGYESLSPEYRAKLLAALQRQKGSKGAASEGMSVEVRPCSVQGLHGCHDAASRYQIPCMGRKATAEQIQSPGTRCLAVTADFTGQRPARMHVVCRTMPPGRSCADTTPPPEGLDGNA